MSTETTEAAPPQEGAFVKYTGGGGTALRNLRTLEDFARAAGVKLGTVYSYRNRGYLPEPIGSVGPYPVWSASQLAKWVRARAQRAGS